MLKEFKKKYFSKYLEEIWDLKEKLRVFEEKTKTLNFDFLKINSSVFSSKIEWNSLDLNSFSNLDFNKKTNKEKKEIDDLILAYDFAYANNLSEKNFLKAHKIATKSFLIEANSWKYRREKVWVFSKNWLVYMALEPEKVNQEMKKFFSEIKDLLNEELSIEEIFFYSSFIHLRLAHIHPFFDWNWRMARLIEKWFLAQKLSKDFWKIQSEEYYFKNRELYYKNINLWVNFYELDYSKSINFLKMLVDSLSYV